MPAALLGQPTAVGVLLRAGLVAALTAVLVVARRGHLALRAELPAPALEVPVQRLRARGDGLVAGARVDLRRHLSEAEAAGVQPPRLGQQLLGDVRGRPPPPRPRL